MNGFDSYMPEKWIDQVFSVPLQRGRTTYKKRGMHAGPIKYATGVFLCLLGAASAISIPNHAIMAATKVVDIVAYPEPARHSADTLSPVGYFDKLFTAISFAERLSDESFEFDPPIFV